MSAVVSRSKMFITYCARDTIEKYLWTAKRLVWIKKLPTIDCPLYVSQAEVVPQRQEMAFEDFETILCDG
jgi:hypothetical protein